MSKSKIATSKPAAISEKKDTHPGVILGVVIGTSTGWDQTDTFGLALYDLVLNETGRKFLPGFVDGGCLGVDFDRGDVACFIDETETPILADWSVFNKAK